jgi:hypothetical protein
MSNVTKHIEIAKITNDGTFENVNLLLLVNSKNYDYIVTLSQFKITMATEVKLFRRDKGSNQICGFKFDAVDHVEYRQPRSKAIPIPMIIDAINQMCPTQLDLFHDQGDVDAFNALLNLIQTSNDDGLNRYVLDLNSLKRPKHDLTTIDIFYKSENTTIEHRPHKIVMFVVTNEADRNDVYALAYPRIDDDAHFRALMSHLRNGRHGLFMKTMSDHLKLGKCRSERVDPELRDGAVICLTSPRSEDGIVDHNIRPMHAYKLIDTTHAIDGHTYLHVINDRGVEVSRRQNHFVHIPRMRKHLSKQAA